MGGVGKTTIAAALVMDEEIRSAFDKIAWVVRWAAYTNYKILLNIYPSKPPTSPNLVHDTTSLDRKRGAG